MAENDYYKILEVSRTASADQIKSAYRKLAKKYHPDRNPNDKTAEDKFKEVREAYDVLSNAQKRQAYDQFGAAGIGGGPFGGWRSGPSGERVYTWKSGGGPDIPFENLEDLFDIFSGGGRAQTGGSIFEDFFNQAGGRGRSPRSAGKTEPSTGLDIEHAVELTFEQAVHGTKLELGLTPSSGTTKKITVKIPAGVAQGQRIRVRGKGRTSGRPAKTGDLYIICKIQPHRYFRRAGNDIYLDLPISVSEAVLGAKVEIPTLDGKTILTVPPGTASGTRLRLKNKGVKPAGKKKAGDQYAVIRIMPPAKPTKRQREIMEQWDETGDDSPRKNTEW